MVRRNEARHERTLEEKKGRRAMLFAPSRRKLSKASYVFKFFKQLPKMAKDHNADRKQLP